MKLHFAPIFDCELRAIEALSDLFRGPEVLLHGIHCDDEAARAANDLGCGGETDLGVANWLTLLDDPLFQNLRDVQLRSGFAPYSVLTSGDFAVEMETGTGRAYV